VYICSSIEEVPQACTSLRLEGSGGRKTDPAIGASDNPAARHDTLSARGRARLDMVFDNDDPTIGPIFCSPAPPDPRHELIDQAGHHGQMRIGPFRTTS
jgi:hypothetical protein